MTSEKLDTKYHALLGEARRRGGADVLGMQLCFQLLSLAGGIDRECAARLAPHGLTEGRFVLLFLLDAAQQGVAPHVLAQRAGVTRATITTLLDGLQREGLVLRRADAQDRRALTVHLTAKGKRLALSLVGEHAQWIGQVFGHLSGPEREQLAILLAKAADRSTADDKE
ncbi:MarR family winged helix-turn-helix transcriptional regulator [Alcaligenes sp. SDU_A2]|uniref:MarR family winged helix-turn-helix transcriptional regulator n=1 Tax=Alcaligenes sp. SDU_A2 TaxID=3136634 RepID=UPI00311F2B5C